MKKIVLTFLVITFLFSIVGCGKSKELQDSEEKSNFSVPHPMEYPVYTFEYTPNQEDLRYTAISAMRDLLSIQWHTPIEIAYRKTGPVSAKHFKHHPNTIYAGTIYSNASTGLFQFLEFYDYKTGAFSYPGSVNEMKEALGNSCADSLLWGWSTVCNSISGGYYPATMVYANGYRPVGDYKYDFRIRTFNQYPTQKILEKNGEERMLECYMQVQPADALITTTDNHAMMAIEAPHVVYLSDGSIDLERSYITIQDQRGGSGAGFYEQTVNGNVLHYSGRLSFNFTFAELLKQHYIPVTTDEFLGVKKYEEATVSLDNVDCNTPQALMNTSVSSNYPLAVVRATLVEESGKETVLDRVLFDGALETGVPKTYSFKNMDCLQDIAENKGCTLRIDVIVSTGQLFTPVEIQL